MLSCRTQRAKRKGNERAGALKIWFMMQGSGYGEEQVDETTEPRLRARQRSGRPAGLECTRNYTIGTDDLPVHGRRDIAPALSIYWFSTGRDPPRACADMLRGHTLVERLRNRGMTREKDGRMGRQGESRIGYSHRPLRAEGPPEMWIAKLESDRF